jgi:sulfur-carrier protein
MGKPHGYHDASTHNSYTACMQKPLTILYFAWLRELIGTATQTLPLPDGVATVAALMRHLAATSPAHAVAFAPDRKVRCAVNQEFASPDTPIAPGDEIGFFPPVTGG